MTVFCKLRCTQLGTPRCGDKRTHKKCVWVSSKVRRKGKSTMLFYNPAPDSVREKAEESSDLSFHILADSLNNIERYGNYKDTKTQRHLRHLIPRLDTWKRQLESVAASSDGLDVLMYHISNTYDTRGRSGVRSTRTVRVTWTTLSPR